MAKNDKRVEFACTIPPVDNWIDLLVGLYMQIQLSPLKSTVDFQIERSGTSVCLAEVILVECSVELLRNVFDQLSGEPAHVACRDDLRPFLGIECVGAIAGYHPGRSELYGISMPLLYDYFVRHVPLR